MPDWVAKPPEVNAAELMAGDHAASITAAAASYEALADALISEGAAMGVNTSGTAAGGWQGVGGLAMLGTAATYIAALEALSAWVQAAAAATAGIAEAYDTAFANTIPEPVCTVNRITQAGLVASNFGQNTPAIIALDTEYFGHMWTNNAAVMGAYESAVMMFMDTLAVPPPIAPLTANPAGMAGQAASVAQAAAQVGTNAALSQGVQSVTDSAGAVQPSAQAAASPAGAGESMGTSMLGQLAQLPQMAGQLPQMAGQLPQMLGQVPQMLGQLPQMAMGMLGPLAGGNMGDLAAAGADPAATVSQTALTTGGMGAGAGGGGGGFGASGAGVISSFTRPAGSFNAPNPPKLPTGWSAAGAEPPSQVAASTQPASGGMGGLYGAPAAMAGREGAAAEKTPTRTMQLTGRPAPNRGDDQQN